MAGSIACREGYLEIVATRVGIEVKQFSHNIKSGDKPRLHCLGINLFGIHTALGDNGRIVVASADKGKFHIL